MATPTPPPPQEKNLSSAQAILARVEERGDTQSVASICEMIAR